MSIHCLSILRKPFVRMSLKLLTLHLLVHNCFTASTQHSLASTQYNKCYIFKPVHRLKSVEPLTNKGFRRVFKRLSVNAISLIFTMLSEKPSYLQSPCSKNLVSTLFSTFVHLRYDGSTEGLSERKEEDESKFEGSDCGTVHG